MVLAVLLILGSIVVLILGGLILGFVIVSAGSNQSGGAFSARRDWMNSHIEDKE